MFKPVPMQHADLFLIRDDLEAAGLALAACGVFQPQAAAGGNDALPERPGTAYAALYRSAQGRLEKILHRLRLAPAAAHADRRVDTEELRALDARLAALWRACSRWERIEQRLHERQRQLDHLERVLDKYEVLGIDLALLHGGLRFLDLHIGAVARADIARLRRSVSLIGYTLLEFLRDGENSYVIVAGLKQAQPELRAVLFAASFHPLELPPEFRDRPERLRHELQHRRRRLATDRARLARRLQGARVRYGPLLSEISAVLAAAAPCAQLAELLVGRGALLHVRGWTPRSAAARLRACLQSRLGTRFLLQLREPRPEESASIPTLVRHPPWLAPFARLVRNYGVPRYNELDPTWLFALTFTLMFGMMFGDLGQGLAIAGAGLVLRRRLRGYAPLFVAAGLAAAVFGVLYGSVFGRDDVLPALWLNPLSDPYRLLGAALACGVSVIGVSTLWTMRNRFAAGDRRGALLGTRGAAGGLVYAAGAVTVYRWFTGATASVAGTVMLAGLAAIVTHRWRYTTGTPAERAVVIAVQTFEDLISYLANTLSFLRLAAFSLVHVILTLVVFDLAARMGAVGHALTVVLGNVLIIGLEGAVVAIQALRLEYYEGFSRIFGGDGNAFRPLAVMAPAAQLRN